MDRDSGSIVFMVIISLYGCWGAITNLETEISSHRVAISKSVIFTCTVEREDSTDNTPVYFAKYIQLGKKRDIINPMGGMTLDAPFQGRYYLDKQSNGNTDTFTLEVSDLEVEDNADFECYTSDRNSIQDFEVITNPANVEMDNNNGTNSILYGNDETVDFHENFGSGLRCTVHEGNSDTEIKLIVDDYNYLEETDYFQKVVIPGIACAPEGDDDSCIMHREFKLEVKSSNFVPLSKHNNKDLVCAAGIPNKEVFTTSSSINIRLTMRPYISSPSDRVEADIGSSAQIECNFDANPEVTDAWWRVEEDGEDYRLGDGDNTPSGEISAQVDLNNHVMMLIFSRVEKHHHKIQTYYALAENELGQTEFKTYITEVGAPHPGAGYQTTASGAVVFCLLLIAIFTY